jgi:probable HAF family extracellular repeat protein
MNSQGVIVGASCVNGTGNHAVRFRGPGEIDDLGTLGGYWSSANAINDAGVIVGLASLVDGVYHGFVYADGKITDAGAPPGLIFSELVAINGSGVAVGRAYNNNGDLNERGTVSGAGKTLDLNTLVERTPYTITAAVGIDESGNIVAKGSGGGGIAVVLLRPH